MRAGPFQCARDEGGWRVLIFFWLDGSCNFIIDVWRRLSHAKKILSVLYVTLVYTQKYAYYRQKAEFYLHKPSKPKP